MNRTKVRQLRKDATEAERVLWKHLRLRQIAGCKFRRQQPIGRYIVDFVCLERRLIIEVDGGQHSEQVSYDMERDAWLEKQGFRIPPPSSSPARGEGIHIGHPKRMVRT